jgi:anti-sigma regulatory factor (Ser/Thr protein kinase)
VVTPTDFRSYVETLLPAELESVGAARRLCCQAMSEWHFEETMIQDVALAVSELTTNAVLHARTEVTVSFRRLGSGVRIEVRDGSSHLPVVEAARPEDLLLNRSMTGRGLALVAAVADRWGADPALPGKVTWAEVGTGTRLVASAAPPAFPPAPKPPEITPTEAQAGVTAAFAVTGGGRTVHLIGVPVRLLIESTRQLAELQREMQVIAMDAAAPAELGRVAQTGESFNTAIDMWAQKDRCLAEQALAQGVDRLDWDVKIPADIDDWVDRVTAWLRRSASSLVRRQLLSEPASAAVTAYRVWYKNEIMAQLSGRAPQPCPLEVPEGY